MPKHEKGILGVKKDPKKQILFSFGARQGDEWPSDDSDSDYEPTQLETEKYGLEVEGKLKRRKSASKDGTKNKKYKKTFDESKATSSKASSKTQSPVKGNIWGAKIPPEILLLVFKHVVDDSGPLPFLCRASRVCSLWKDVAQQASLWHNVDLSYGWVKQKEKTLRWLCNNRLSSVRHLSLSMWKNLTNEHLEVVADHCPHLVSINLSHCSKIGYEGLKTLLDKCCNLSGLDLSSMHSKAVSPQSLCYVAEKCADKLKSLNVSGNQLVSFAGVLNKVAEHCHNMEVLEVNNCIMSTDFLVLNIEKLQAGCPNLKILRMANIKVMSRPIPQREQEKSQGFPNLTELSLALNFEGVNTGIGVDDVFLHRLLKNACKLKLLDLRGCTHLTSNGLQKLSATDLQSLFISQCSIAKYDGIEIIMQKWQHSLQELDLSWNVYPGMSLDLAMRKLSDDPNRSKLQIVNLGGTSISCGRIKSLLEGCPNLKSINLVSCRGLPRGMKREYSGQALVCLRKEIDSIVEKEDLENNVKERESRKLSGINY